MINHHNYYHMTNQENQTKEQKAPLTQKDNQGNLVGILQGAKAIEDFFKEKIFEDYADAVKNNKQLFLKADQARQKVLMNKDFYSAATAIQDLIDKTAASGKMKLEIKVKNNHDSFAAAFAYFQQELGYDVVNNTAKKTKEQKSKGQMLASGELHEFYEISWKFKKQTNA